MAAQSRVITWILRDNLRLFLERVSALIGYCFDDWDWDAIRFGVGDTDAARGHSYDYDLSGTPPVKLAFADAGDARRLHVNVETEELTADRMDAFARIMQCYDETTASHDLETLVQAAFIDTPMPDQNKIVACDAVHLAQSPECQETLAFFKGRYWIDLLRGKEPLPLTSVGSRFSPQTHGASFSPLIS